MRVEAGVRSRTDYDPVGEDEEGDVGGEGTQHQAPRHHDTTEDGHGTSTKILHARAADGTCAEWRQRGEREEIEVEREREREQ